MLNESWHLTHPEKWHPVVLTFKEKIAFLKLLCSSPFVSGEERQQICERVYVLVHKGNIFNDLVNRCDMGIPDPNLKRKLWETVSDPFNEDSLQVYFW